MSYYRSFRIVIGSRLWRWYVHKVYEENLADLEKISFWPDFSREGFTCLLCGVGNEATAEVFINFVFSKNPKARIVIIDLGAEQIEAVKQMVKEKFTRGEIEVRQMNALDLAKWIDSGSIDWIETDVISPFFDDQSLEKLFKVWGQLLTKSGFVTNRVMASRNVWERMIERIVIWLGKIWLGVKLYPRSKKSFEAMLTTQRWRFVDVPTILPTLWRYAMVGV